MPNMTILQANIDAALNKQRLSEGDSLRRNTMRAKRLPATAQGARISANQRSTWTSRSAIYCAVPCYANGYGSRDVALSLLDTLPAGARDNVFKADYSGAEKSCPQNIQIRRVLKRVCEDLG